MIKYTRHSLKKIEELFTEINFKVRYEKGNFQSGYCIVDQRDIIVINKFFDVEGRINCLLEIIEIIEIDPTQLSENGMKILQAARKTYKLQNEPETEPTD